MGNDLFGHSNAYGDAISFVFKKTELITLVRNMHGTLDNESDKNQKNDARQTLQHISVKRRSSAVFQELKSLLRSDN